VLKLILVLAKLIGCATITLSVVGIIKMSNASSRKLLGMIFVLTMLMSFSLAQGAPVDKPMGRIALPPLKRAPVIDGEVMTGAEWYNAAQIYGFVSYDQGIAEVRLGYALVGFDATHLYFAVVTQIPPKGSIVANEKRRDGQVVHDDGIEIFIDPHRAGGKTNRKIYQFLGNSKGVIFDKTFTADGKKHDQDWNGKWKFANQIKKGYWRAEVAIALKDIGASADDLRRGIGFFVGRDWKQPFAFSGITVRGYSWYKTYPVLVWDDKAPVVRIKALGNLNRNRLNLNVSFHNRLPTAEKIKVVVRVESSNLPARTDEKVIELAPKGRGKYRYSFDNSIDTDNEFSMRVTSLDGGKVYFERSVKYRHVTTRAWNTREDMKGPIGLDIAYYPYLGKLRARVRTDGLAPGTKLEKAEVVVLSPDGAQLAKGDIREFVKKMGETVLILPKLPDGTYKVVARPVGPKVPKVTAERTFLRKNFVWEGNNLGISEEVFPPFTPLVVDGDEVSCVLRKYKFNRLGLWSQVTSKGKELLAAPMKISVAAGGKSLGWRAERAHVVKANPGRVIIRGFADNERMTLATRTTYDIDGCMKVEMTMSGKGSGGIDELTLDIPLKNEMVSLYHVNADRIRSNPSGSIPKGEGVIFDGMKLKRRWVLGSFVNYVWLGGTERGLAWFADSDKGWVIDDAKPSITLVRSGNVLHLRIHIVRAPTELKTERNLVFGLMASPAKPMMENWRSWTWAVPYENYPKLQWLFYSGEIAPGPYPHKYQMEFLDKWAEVRRTGETPKAFIEQWCDQFKGMEEHKTFYIRHVRAFFGVARKNPDIFMPILDSHEIAKVLPEFHVFQDEWDLKEYRNRHCLSKVHSRADRHTVTTIDPVRSYTDFTVYYSNEQMKRGIGQYLDNCFPHTNHDSLVSEAYVRADGQVQGAGRIWHIRERVRRLAVLQHKHGLRAIMCHMTNGNLLPVLSFATMALDWEWKYGNAPLPERFPADLIRAQSIGLQTGCVPFVLTGIKHTKSDAEAKGLTRQLWGLATVHEIKTTDRGKDREFFTRMETKRFDFGYGLKDCRIFRYWDPKPAAKVEGGEVYWIAYARGGKVMLILFNCESKPVDATILLNKKALGLPIGLKVMDGEADPPRRLFETKSERMKIPLEKFGVRMLIIDKTK